MNDGCAIERNRRHKASLHQIDQHRTQSRLDDMSTEAPHHACATLPGVDHRARNGLEIRRGKDVRQRVEELRHRSAVADRAGEILRVSLALPRLQRIGADAGEIELFVRTLHRDTPYEI